MPNPKDDKVFKLVFSTDGTFKYAEAPDGSRAKTLTFKDMNDFSYYDKKNNEEISFKDLLLTGKRESIKLVDLPGHSICGGVCGGIAFSWC